MTAGVGSPATMRYAVRAVCGRRDGRSRVGGAGPGRPALRHAADAGPVLHHDGANNLIPSTGFRRAPRRARSPARCFGKNCLAHCCSPWLPCHSVRSGLLPVRSVSTESAHLHEYVSGRVPVFAADVAHLACVASSAPRVVDGGQSGERRPGDPGPDSTDTCHR